SPRLSALRTAFWWKAMLAIGQIPLGLYRAQTSLGIPVYQSQQWAPFLVRGSHRDAGVISVRKVKTCCYVFNQIQTSHLVPNTQSVGNNESDVNERKNQRDNGQYPFGLLQLGMF